MWAFFTVIIANLKPFLARGISLMDTPITVSSTLSSVNKSTKKSVAHRSVESSAVRVPIGWQSPAKSYDRESSCTPTTLQKVNSWINSLHKLNRRNVDSNSRGNTSRNPSSDFNEFDNALDTEYDYLRRLKISSDFSKSDLNEDKMIELELDQYCSDTYPYEKTRGSDRGQRKHSYLKAIKRRKFNNTANLIEAEVNKSDGSMMGDVPLSPESEKKKELCRYLQLMKPTDKKTVMILQNRRSVRVKNLSLMQEKRDLEKKLREENSEERSDNSLSKAPELQIVEQIDTKTEEKRSKWLKYRGVIRGSNDTFHFPHPKDNLKDTVTDFDEVMQEDWFKNWKTQRNEQKLINNSGRNSKSVDIETENAKARVGSQITDDEIDNIDLKTRLETKRTCVINQQNANNEKKVKALKNSVKVELKKGPARVNNQNKPKLLNGASKRQERNGLTRKRNEPQKALLQDIKNVPGHHPFPKATLHLTAGICDFGNVIQERKDIIEDSFVFFGSKSAPSIKQKVAAAKKKHTKSLMDLAPEDTVINSNRKSKPSNTLKTELLPPKKEQKRRKSLLFGRSSSFKIKLVSKKRNSGSPNKGNNKSLKTITSDVITESPPKAGETSVKEVESPATKKENLKEKVQSPKRSKVIAKPLLKSPLRDTNETNPLTQDVAPESQIPDDVNKREESTSNEETLKTINLLSKLPALEISSRPISPIVAEMKSVDKKKSERDQESPPSTIMAIFKDEFNEVSDIDAGNEQVSEGKAEFYCQILNIEKSSDEDSELPTAEEITEESNNTDLRSSSTDIRVQIMSSPNSPKSARVSNKGGSTPVSSKEETYINTSLPTVTSFNKDSAVNPLHKCLTASKQKSATVNLETESSPTNWASGSPSYRQKKNQHSIHILKEHGLVLKIFYMEYNLVVCQESLVSLWTQTSLGNVLGAQNMWISKGSVQRLSMNNNCVFKESLEMVASTDTGMAYVELWTKEHQSEIREGPVADVFATVYFWKKGHHGMDKKVLQLQNINGFADDVQYSVLKSSPKIVVSWHLASNELENKKTFIHCYKLAADFQSVCNISEFEAVEHYVSSLHNIEGCDTLIMGCGENKITLWNIEHGYIAATIEMLDIKSPLSTLWVKCDRGFLFTLQQCVDRELRLIAIHGMNHSWKKLASYVAPEEYDRLKGVWVENGIVLAFYDQGIVCWNAQTAEMVLETMQNEAEYISGQYIISIVDDQVNLRHAVTYLLSAEET